MAAFAALLVRPTRRLAPRVRPYTVISRTSLGNAPDVLSVATPGPLLGDGVASRLFGPMIQGAASRLGRLMESAGEESMALKLRQAGFFTTIPDERRLQEYRIRQLGRTIGAAVLGVLIGVVVGAQASTVVVLGVLGFIVGVTRGRASIDHEIEDRRNRMRIEIYTVNQLLAVRVRVGGGVVQAVQQIVARGRGAVVEELAEALRLHRGGLAATEAFERIATTTPEPHCARTYSLISASEHRGSDLAAALLSLSEDVRGSRREAMRRAATKRRAAMLIPTIAILAPVMLLFVAAPLPSIIFGNL